MKNTRIVGLLGIRGAGKDTCALSLVNACGFTRAAFADSLYQEVAEAFGVSVEFLANRDTKETPLAELALQNCKNPDFIRVVLQMHGYAYKRRWVMRMKRSPRWVLQYWGTEYRRRSQHGTDSYWLDKVAALMDSRPESSFVITDVRFVNEARFILEKGGVLVRIRRESLEHKAEEERRLKKGAGSHSSETELLGFPVWRELFNLEGNPGALESATLAMAQELRGLENAA